MVEKKSSLLGYVKKERNVFARYNRSHPRFKWNIAIDAVLATVLVLGGYALLTKSSADAQTDALRKSGGVAMTSSELIKYVKDEGVFAYWLGSIPGNDYTIISTDRSNIIVTYVAHGSKLNDVHHNNLVVETLTNSILAEGLLRSNISLDSDDFMTTTGNSGMFSRTSPHKATFIIEPGTVVEIHYPSLQTIQSVRADGEKLKRIS